MIPSTGWYVEIDDPGSSHTWTPEIAGEPEIVPAANDYPRIKIPVEKRDRWTQDRYLDADIRVWRDGERLPIDKFKKPEETERALILNGRGGEELDTRVQKEYDVKPIHEAAEDLINNETSYVANVDTPPANTVLNSLLEEVDTDSALQAFFNFTATDPVTVTGGELTTLQTAFHGEGEDIGGGGGVFTAADASEGEAETIFDASHEGSATFTLDYDIPDGEVGIAARFDIPNDPNNDGIFQGPPTDLLINGSTVDTLTDNTNVDSDYRWQTASANVGGLSAGQHSFGYDVTKDGESNTLLDLIVVYDQRFSYTFDSTADSDSLLSGPETKPDLVEVLTDDVANAFQITGGRCELTIDDTSNDQFVAVSNDRGSNYTRADNSATVEGDFATGTPQIRAKIGLSRYGSRTTETPTTGFEGQSVDVLKLFADINKTPLLVNQDFDGTLHDVLNEMAELGYFFWEYRRSSGTESIEWTRPGQRATDADTAASSYSWSRDVEGKLERIVVVGGRRKKRGEQITANHGTAVALEEGRIDHGTEEVYDPNTGEQFVEGDDYELGPGVETDTGSITALANGNITDGQALEVNYAFHPEGVWTDPNAGSDPRTEVRTIPPLATDRGCAQAAQQLGFDLDTPLEQAQITIPTSDVGYNIVDAQQFSDLPTDTALDIRDITRSPSGITFSLGSRSSINETIQRFSRRIESAASRT